MRQDNSQKRSISFYLARGIKTDLDYYCQNAGISQTQAICKAIDVYLQRKKTGRMSKCLRDPYPVYNRDLKGRYPISYIEEPDMTKIPMVVRIPQTLDDALETYCQKKPYIEHQTFSKRHRKKRTKSLCIREAVSQYLYNTEQEIRDKLKKPKMPDLFDGRY